MAATAATTTALSITEVLESILVVCRPYDVLHAQRVCSYWRTLIQTSKTLQRKLFLAPSGYDEEIETDLSGISNDTAFFMIRAATDVAWNPFFNSIFVPYEVNYNQINAAISDSTLKLSCHRMYITSPPVQVVRIEWFSLTGCAEARDGVGVTVGDVMEGVRAVFGGHPHTTSAMCELGNLFFVRKGATMDPPHAQVTAFARHMIQYSRRQRRLLTRQRRQRTKRVGEC